MTTKPEPNKNKDHAAPKKPAAQTGKPGTPAAKPGAKPAPKKH